MGSFTKHNNKNSSPGFASKVKASSKVQAFFQNKAGESVSKNSSWQKQFVEMLYL